jgi:hypothetical protein
VEFSLRNLCACALLLKIFICRLIDFVWLRVKQQICYALAAPPPDTSISNPTCASPTLPDHSPDPPVKPSWKPQELPVVVVKGVMFGRNVEVECKASNNSLNGTISIAHLFLSSRYLYVVIVWCLRLLIHDLLDFIPSERQHPSPPHHDKQRS